MKIRFLGVSSSINATGIGSSILIDDQILIDAPATCNARLLKSNIDLTKISDVFISHLHGDHFIGLPFLLIEYMLLDRTMPLNIYGDNKLEKTILDFLALVYPDINTNEQIKKSNSVFHSINEDKEIKIGNIYISPFDTKHSPNSKGFIIRENDKKVLFTSDTSLFDNLYEKIDECDEIMIDGTTYDLDIPGHISFMQIKDLACQFKGKRFFVVHRGKYGVSLAYENIVLPNEDDVVCFL